MFELKIDGLGEMLSALDRFADEMVDFRRVEQPLKEVFHRAEQGQFDTQGARGGTPWQSLSEAYAPRKEKQFPGKPIEQRTGALMRSLTGDTPDSISVVDRESFEFGTALPYAQYQQQDGSGTYPGLLAGRVVGAGGGTIPARPLIELTDEDEQAMGQIILGDAAAHARSLGFGVEG